MRLAYGMLYEGDKVVFERVAVGDYESGKPAWIEVHAGGLMRLAEDRPYRLVLDDGTTAIVRVGRCQPCGTGIAKLPFRAFDLGPEAVGTANS